MENRDSVLVVGAGFVGLATATFIASRGYRVTVVEKNKRTLTSLKGGQLHFHEPGIADRFDKLLRSGKLRFVPPTREVYEQAGIVFVAIDSADQRSWQMRTTAFEQIAEWMGGLKRRRPAMVVLKSTNVLGFAELFQEFLDRTPHGSDVHLTVSPEFLREGYAYEDTAKPWRVIVGARDDSARKRLAAFYRTLYSERVSILTGDWRSAELIKLGANLYLSHRLTYINEISEYAHREGLDIDLIRQGIGLDPRIGLDYFDPGLGFGGSCLPKDCHLINSRQLGGKFTFRIAETALEVNDCILDGVAADLKGGLGTLRGKRIALLGLAFKPETDDTRGSQALKLANKLRRRGARVAAYDPYVRSVGGTAPGRFTVEPDIRTALKGSTAIVIGTAHTRFRSLRAADTAGLVRGRVISDRFRILKRASWEKVGFEFV